MSDSQEKLDQFIAITGANRDRADFFLESAAWNVEVAVSRYYEVEGGEDLDDVAPPDTPSPTLTPDRSKANRSSNFATLNTLTTSSDDDDDEEEGQAYYAGGSENSGQQILGPSKKKDIVANMFKSVHEHGVEILESGSTSRGGNKAFRGTGYKLGQDESSSVVIPGVAEAPRPQEVTLKLWQDGFSVDDGEFRAYNDHSNKDFLDCISRGEIPNELRQNNTEVHLSMEDHRMERHSTVPQKLKPFQGHGYTLGNVAPVVVGGCTNENNSVKEDQAEKKLIKVDQSKPTTSLQIRLADGSRIIGQFNHEHTIGQIRQYIITARPQYATQSFNLLSIYPSKILSDTETIQEAGLLNAAIMQKLT